MKTLIKGGTIVNEGRSFIGDILVEGDRICDIQPTAIHADADEIIDAAGCRVLPGVIDEHVHFRDPGLTEKADMDSESRAAAFGGVTSYFDMPNCVPQTTTMEALADKYQHAETASHVNYAFFLGATNDNVDLYQQLLAPLPATGCRPLPAVKLFMGSSTGNMLVDKQEALDNIFATCARLGLVVMTHCEDTTLINRNMQFAKAILGDDPSVDLHYLIRSREACLESSRLAVSLARKHGTRLHIAHISTEEELLLLDPAHGITGEACVPHLLFDHDDHHTRGALIKCNPAIKTHFDRQALRQAVADGRITTIATDHAPHLLTQKQGGAARATSGMPMVQFSLVSILGLVDGGVLPIERLVELMAHAPARLFGVKDRGFLRPSYKADITIVRPNSPWTLTKDVIQSKCAWSPLEGDTFQWRVEHTICNGHHIYNKGKFHPATPGQPIEFLPPQDAKA